MDPDEALRKIRLALAKIDAAERLLVSREVALDAIESLREHVEALDKWITNGGFLPDAWRPKC